MKILRKNLIILGYFLEVLIASNCEAGCYKCIISEKSNECVECLPKYGKINFSSCGQCTIKNCLHCDWDLQSCDTCISGSFIKKNPNNSRITCEECILGCKNCSNTEKCQECRFLYEMTSEKKCRPKYWLFLLFALPTLYFVISGFCYPENWFESIKNKKNT